MFDQVRKRYLSKLQAFAECAHARTCCKIAACKRCGQPPSPSSTASFLFFVSLLSCQSLDEERDKLLFEIGLRFNLFIEVALP